MFQGALEGAGAEKNHGHPKSLAKKFQIGDGFGDSLSVAELQRQDNRVTQRRVGRVAAVFTLAGGASPAPTDENHGHPKSLAKKFQN